MLAQGASFAFEPWPTKVAFVFHVGGGTIALVSGLVAVFARKGERLHRAAGSVFLVSMVVMAVFADYLAVVMPDQIANLFIGTFTFYLVFTAWTTVRRKAGTTDVSDRIALFLIACLFVPFAILSFQLAFGITPMVRSAVPFKGPVLIAIYVFTAVVAIATIADAKVLVAGGISGARRIARHLWRMCLGLALAAGSAFTNGLPRLMPQGVHIPLVVQFVPQLSVLGLLIFWMIRMRFTDYYRRNLQWTGE